VQHQEFLPNLGFQRREIHNGKNLQPIHKTTSQWLIRCVSGDGSAKLLLGNDNGSPLSWPNHDPQTVEMWRLTIATAYADWSGPGLQDQQLKGLAAKHLLVRWDRDGNAIQMAEIS
jgi:hypothetical protein